MGKWAQSEFDRVLLSKIGELYNACNDYYNDQYTDARFRTFIRDLNPQDKGVQACFRSLIQQYQITRSKQEDQEAPCFERSREPVTSFDAQDWDLIEPLLPAVTSFPSASDFEGPSRSPTPMPRISEPVPADTASTPHLYPLPSSGGFAFGAPSPGAFTFEPEPASIFRDRDPPPISSSYPSRRARALSEDYMDIYASSSSAPTQSRSRRPRRQMNLRDENALYPPPIAHASSSLSISFGREPALGTDPRAERAPQRISTPTIHQPLVQPIRDGIRPAFIFSRDTMGPRNSAPISSSQAWLEEYRSRRSDTSYQGDPSTYAYPSPVLGRRRRQEDDDYHGRVGRRRVDLSDDTQRDTRRDGIVFASFSPELSLAQESGLSEGE